ncbi:MAG: ADP-ribosylation factor-like protein [Candidatus Hodarchaeales archaeon]
MISYQEVTQRLGHKILLSGLSEAGKTAVKRIFFLKHSTEDVNNLAATINYERMSVIIKDVPISIVDLGGQTFFIKRFLDDFSPFIFSTIKAFIFVVDVENRTTRNNAIQYFSACIKKLNEFSPEAEIFVFLHKNDLIFNSPNYESIHRQFKENFQQECPTPIRFFRTTIYRPETVTNAFGRIFEVAMPQLAWNELVDEKTIGVIEEFHEKIKLGKDIDIKAPRKIGDQAVLEKLGVIIKKRRSKTKRTPDSEFVSPLTSFLGDTVAKEEVPSHEDVVPTQESAYDHYSKEMMPSSEEIERMINYIKNFVEFYGIEPDEATQIVNSGYSVVFEAVVTSGINVSLATDVILKQIPYIKSEGLKTENLTPNRLLEIFSAFVKGLIKEKEELFKCMIFTVKNPTQSISEIINNYFFRKAPRRKVRESKRKAEKIDHEVAEFRVPYHVEINDGVITLPNTNGLGFNVDLVNINASINFFYEGRNIGNSMIPATLDIDEIIFLMAYEMNMIDLGYFQKDLVPLKIAARIIHEIIRILTEDSTLQSSNQIKNLKGAKMNLLQLIIPFKLPVVNILPEASYYVLPESEDIAFTVVKVPEGYLLKFIQHKSPIGQMVTKDLISVGNLNRILTENLQVPIWSQNVIQLASRIINISLEIMIRADKKMKQQPKTVSTPFRRIRIKNGEKTSAKLLSYLDKLEENR